MWCSDWVRFLVVSFHTMCTSSNPRSNFPSHSCFLRWKKNVFWGGGAQRRQNRKLWREEGGEWSMFPCSGDMPHTVTTAILVPTWVCLDIQYWSCAHFLSKLVAKTPPNSFPQFCKHGAFKLQKPFSIFPNKAKAFSFLRLASSLPWKSNSYLHKK